MVKGLGYYSCLLRLWQVGAGPDVAWRALVEEIPGGERRGFADLEGLLAYLREQTDARTGDSVAQGATPPPDAEDG